MPFVLNLTGLLRIGRWWDFDEVKFTQIIFSYSCIGIVGISVVRRWIALRLSASWRPWDFPCLWPIPLRWGNFPKAVFRICPQTVRFQGEGYAAFMDDNGNDILCLDVFFNETPNIIDISLRLKTNIYCSLILFHFRNRADVSYF